jgi:hypothetical protein
MERIIGRRPVPTGKERGGQWMKVVDHKRVTDHTKEVNVALTGASGCKSFLST